MYKLTDNGFILAISATTKDGVEITEQEYNAIISAINKHPESREGFALMIKDENLEWEYIAMPNPADETAEISDYENALYDLGVQFND